MNGKILTWRRYKLGERSDRFLLRFIATFSLPRPIRAKPREIDPCRIASVQANTKTVRLPAAWDARDFIVAS